MFGYIETWFVGEILIISDFLDHFWKPILIKLKLWEAYHLVWIIRGKRKDRVTNVLQIIQENWIHSHVIWCLQCPRCLSSAREQKLLKFSRLWLNHLPTLIPIYSLKLDSHKPLVLVSLNIQQQHHCTNPDKYGLKNLEVEFLDHILNDQTINMTVNEVVMILDLEAFN